MSQPAILFDGVWKKFHRGERHDSLRDLIPAMVKRYSKGRPKVSDLEQQEFWAVRDVAFEVKQGEALGIIGPNGAGKSTILKLLNRILKPTLGRCEVRGRAGALIEVAAGFHPDLTGRENVFLQGAIMGMKRHEIATKFDEIVEFAGVSSFIDTPVKRYSSGMNARLGFAIAAHLDPDVLLIDEVLSVGDAAFQERCLERMRTLVRRGMPLVFISHDLSAVLELCTRAIVVDHGTVRFDGSPAEAVQQYRLVPYTSDAAEKKATAIRIVKAEMMNEVGQANTFTTGGQMRCRIHYEASEPVSDASFAIDIHRADEIYCAGINTLMDKRDLGVLKGTGWVELVIPKLHLLPGYYLISLGILNNAGGTYDLQNRAYPFSITSDRKDLGVVHLEREWRVDTGAVAESRPLALASSRRDRF